jgi:hypothetical protein
MLEMPECDAILARRDDLVRRYRFVLYTIDDIIVRTHSMSLQSHAQHDCAAGHSDISHDYFPVPDQRNHGITP